MPGGHAWPLPGRDFGEGMLLPLVVPVSLIRGADVSADEALDFPDQGPAPVEVPRTTRTPGHDNY